MVVPLGRDRASISFSHPKPTILTPVAAKSLKVRVSCLPNTGSLVIGHEPITAAVQELKNWSAAATGGEAPAKVVAVAM